MRIDFLDPTDAEFIAAIAYYNLQSEGLGYEFAVEIKRTMERILQFPNAWAPLVKTHSSLPNKQIPVWPDLSNQAQHNPDCSRSEPP